MSREPRYRAWDKTTNTMNDVGEIHFCAGGIMVFGNGFTMGNGWASRNDDLPCDVILMQSTGAQGKICKDGRSDDWYEGDIIRVPAHYESDTWIEEYTGQIVFDVCEFYISGVDHFCSLFDAIKNYGAYRIGNMFEDPHLLEQPNE